MKNIPYFNEAFGSIVRTQRENAGMTQKVLGISIGSCARVIAYMEAGKKTPYATTIILLANALKLTPSEFLQEIVNYAYYLENKESSKE